MSAPLWLEVGPYGHAEWAWRKMGSWRGRACVLQNVWFLLGDQDMESAEGAGSASDVGAAGELGSFFHGEDLGFDVAVDFGFVLQFAAV